MKKIQKIVSVLLVFILLPACTMNSNQNLSGNASAADDVKVEVMTNLDIVKSTYEGKTSEENGKNLKRYMTDKTLWTEAAGFPYAGTYQGFDEVEKNVFARLGSEWEEYRFSVEEYVAAGDKVFAYGSYSGTNKASGKYFTARVAHLWVLKDGKIERFEQFVDSKSVTDAM